MTDLVLIPGEYKNTLQERGFTIIARAVTLRDLNFLMHYI